MPMSLQVSSGICTCSFRPKFEEVVHLARWVISHSDTLLPKSL